MIPTRLNHKIDAAYRHRVDLRCEQRRMDRDIAVKRPEANRHREEEAGIDQGGVRASAAGRQVLRQQGSGERDRHDGHEQQQVEKQRGSIDTADHSKTAWWFTQMMPITRKLVR